jgi:menaquinone reductase, multiheme cytochrome c subunit
MKLQLGWFLGGLCCMLFVGWVVFPSVLYERSEQPLQFSHKVHTETAGMTCDVCHVFSEDGRFSGIPSVAKCAECHAETVGSSPHEKLLVDEYVKQNREIPWLVYAKQPQNAYFSHASHVKLANLACDVCHGPHGTTDSLRTYERNRISGYGRDIWGRSIARMKTAQWDGMKMDDCADCHNKRNVPNTCLKCHK